MTPLNKPLRRRIGNLAVTLDRTGMAIKPFRSHRSSLHILWARLIELCKVPESAPAKFHGRPVQYLLHLEARAKGRNHD